MHRTHRVDHDPVLLPKTQRHCGLRLYGLASKGGSQQQRFHAQPVCVCVPDKQCGTQVQFSNPLVVYHVPGKKTGLDVAGMTGTVVEDVTMYKGIELSPNFPYKVQLETEVKGKPRKFFVHVVRCGCLL